MRKIALLVLTWAALTVGLSLGPLGFAEAGSVLTPPSAPATTQLFTPKNGPAQTIQGQLDKVYGLWQWRPAVLVDGFGTNGIPGLAGGGLNAAGTAALQPAGTYRENFIIAKYPVSAIKLRYCNSHSGIGTYATSSSGGEIPGPNAATFTAAIYTNSDPTKQSWFQTDNGQSNPVPVTFNFANSVTLPPDACADTDPINIYMAAGQGFYVYTYCSSSAGDSCPGIDAGGMSGATNLDGGNTGFNNQVITCTGGTGPYTVTSSVLPVLSPSGGGAVKISAPGNSVSADNGSGSIPAGNGIAAGSTVNYATGLVTINFTSACANGTLVNVNITGGGTPADETKNGTLSNFWGGGANNQMAGPQAILGLPGGPALMRGECGWGDSILNGTGNTNQVVSWFNYSNTNGYGVIKGAISGEMAKAAAITLGRNARMQMMGGQVCDRTLVGWGTNDLADGRSLSQLIGDYLTLQRALSSQLPSRSGAELWAQTIFPRTNTSNVPLIPGSGPYTAAGAAYGSGAVASPTPLGGAYNSGVLGAGILGATITGNGTVGPYNVSFSGATMIGSLWSDGLYTTLADSGAGGAGATTLTGSRLSTGTHTPSAGAVSLTFAANVPNGQVVQLYAFATGPSARNAWNYWLYNYGIPKGLWYNVVDVAACVESTPSSQLGAGNGIWFNRARDTADGTHPTPTGHQTTIPGCISPTGTTPSPFFTLK